jgi:hypothetical protein
MGRRVDRVIHKTAIEAKQGVALGPH